MTPTLCASILSWGLKFKQRESNSIASLPAAPKRSSNGCLG